eukprot:SAG31_NODE_741_length_12429_cov_13.571127_4_plen_1359_part_00
MPAGATIHSSRISFTVDEVQPESLQPLTIIIRAQASDNAPAFRQDENDISDRSTLSTAVDWVIDEWLTVGDSISTVEVGVLVQEIIQRSGWMAGNAILFTFGYVSGQGTRWAKADDPSIVISYTVTESNSFDPCWGVDCGPSSTGRCVSGLCQCTSGYTGAACQTPPDLCQYMSCGVRSTHCVSGECLCEPGWAGNTCEIDVSAPNPCAYVSCGLHGRCVVGLCDCTDGYSGAACENRPDFCAGVVCSNGGTCVDGACACTSLYRGTRCETRDIDLCSLDCGNHGTCVAGSCLCEEGWTGPSCTQVGSSPCHFTSCGAHGTCSVNGTQATCVCTDGYSGDNCEDGPDPCQVLDCGVHGECDTISVSCACAEGWTGPSCAIAIDPCEGITCGEHGFCTHGTCTCIDFYQGVRCEIVPDPCRTAECAPYGLCREESGACECFYGYTGDHCEVAPSLCDSIDCENGHCIGDACICNDFYHGERCEIAPAPLCFGVLCGNNGICNPATGKCDCTEGFHGYLCEIRRGPCHDIDCGDNGRCASGACICTNFYTGMLCDTPPTTAATFVSAALHYSVQVSDATHTAEECASGGGTVTVHSSDLELPTDTDGRCAEQIVGIRFAAVHLPAGTSIQSVQIQFIVDEVRAESSFPISLKISVEETDDASSFEHGSVASISRRNMLGTTVLWAADSWPVTGAAVQTPDLSSLVSAILTRPGWAVGNAMVFTFSHWTGQGIRWARSDSPSLVVRYTADDNLWNACAAIDCGFHGRCLSGFCECTDGYTGLACKTPPDLCASVTCESGLCIEGRCNCIAGFGGAFCDTAVVEDPCSGIECGSRGRCTDSSHGCLCTDGYSGRNCEIEPDLCAELSCGVHSTGCVQGVCVCEDGWIGTTCSTNNVCGGVSCGPQGECIAGTCHCTAGFSGSNCELPPAGACEYIDCGSHGECLESLCVCSSGYRGQRCTEVDPCHDMDCNSHGNCSEGSCVCTEAYAGPSCSLCAPGFIEYPNCIDDPCDPEICNGHGLCERNSVTCFCDAGFRGHDCSSCSDGYIEYPRCREDPCSPEKCSGHGICNRTGNGSCTCDANFAGADCSSCSPGFYGYPNCIDDPCDPNPCSGWSRCAVDGSCSCILGYSGLACDIVPLHPCDGVTCSERGTCVNGTCACEEGYAGLECESCASGFISVSNGALPDRSSSAPFCRVEVCISHCNGRGTCVAGLCDCDNEYAGPDCSECSEGFSGYPDCVPSAQQLSVAQLPIAGTHKIRGRISVGTTIDEIPIGTDNILLLEFSSVLIQIMAHDCVGSTLRSEFVESLQRLLAQKMDEAGLTTSVDQISVISILSGSVVVIFEIVATSTSDATTRALCVTCET